MEIVKSLLTKNPCYKSGRKITVKGLMLHSVGCPQPNASVFINNWNNASFNNACVHAFIDANNGKVYQTLPWNHRGWHCGSGAKGSGNNTHIGVEMCEPSCIKYTSGSVFVCSDLSKARASVKRTYESAVELFAMLCKEYNLNPMGDGVIVSHKEGCTRGIATNHGDPEHLWKGLGMSYTMDTFRKDVKECMSSSNDAGKKEPTKTEKPKEQEEPEVLYRVRKSWSDAKSQKGAYEILANAKECADDNPGYSVFDNEGKKLYTSKEVKDESFQVKVAIPNLRIRKGPGTNHDWDGKYTGVGTFTITETSSGIGSNTGWGKLKSGAGWISLDYATRI